MFSVAKGVSPVRTVRTAALLATLTFAAIAGTTAGLSAAESPRCSLWVDVYLGEPLPYQDVLEDLATVRVVYLGECHALKRHHAIQAKVLSDLADKGVPLVLGLEQMEAFQQPALDRYNRGEIDFDQLAKETDWANRWSNYADYRTIVETARKRKIPVIALNARAETIRQVARSGGVAGLDAKARGELPAEIQLTEPLYEKLLNLELMVHMAATPERLRPIREAQMARDAKMASVLTGYLKSEAGKGRTAVVLCGAGHVSYGLGTVSRVRRRMPGVKDRIVLLSQSGDLELSPEEEAMAREIVISHEQLREIDQPVADYLQVRSLKPLKPEQGAK